MTKILKGIVVFMSLLILTPPLNTKTAAAGEVMITKPNFMASISRVAVEKAYNCVFDNDTVCLMKMLESGAVIIMKPGIRVYHVKSDGFFSGYMKIRPEGGTIELWTLIEAVER